MPFILELYDKTNATRLGQLSLIRDASAVFELEGENSLGFKLSINDNYFSSILERKYIRLVDDQDNSIYYSFIIQRLNTVIDRSGDIAYDVQCEGLKYALMDFMIASTNEYFNITVDQALTLITAEADGWSNGTTDPPSSNVATVKFDFTNCLEALHQLIETWVYDDSGNQRHYYYKINEDKTIDILTLANIGSAKDFYIHIDKQLRQFRKDSDCRGMANRVYGVGFDGFTIERANHTDYEFLPLADTATGGGVGYLEDTVNFDTDDLYNGMRFKIHAGTGSGQKRIVDDTLGGVSQRIEPTVNFSPAPDNTSEYRIGHAETGEDMTYDLGAYDSNSDACAKFTQIIINFKMDAVDNSGTATFIVRAQGLTSGDAVVVGGSHKEVMPDLSADNIAWGQIILEVGELTNIDKLLLRCHSCNANGYVWFYNVNYSLSDNAGYIEDTDSQDDYGIVLGKYENSGIIDTINLIKTPALDGTYTAGLCADWIKILNPTLTENTTLDFIHHGTKSQKVAATAVSEGISQEFYVDADKSYSAYVRLYIDASDEGSVLIIITSWDGTGWGNDTFHVISGAGWIELTIENFSHADVIDKYRIQILSFGEASTFYVDSVMIHMGPEIHPFVVGDSADLLYQETLNYLEDNKVPHVGYDLDLLDLYEKDPGIYDQENFGVGDQIRVVDPDISLDSQLLVIRKEFNPLDPQECSVGLARKPEPYRRSLGKVITAAVRQDREV